MVAALDALLTAAALITRAEEFSKFPELTNLMEEPRRERRWARCEATMYETMACEEGVKREDMLGCGKVSQREVVRKRGRDASSDR